MKVFRGGARATRTLAVPARAASHALQLLVLRNGAFARQIIEGARCARSHGATAAAAASAATAAAAAFAATLCRRHRSVVVVACAERVGFKFAYKFY